MMTSHINVGVIEICDEVFIIQIRYIEGPIRINSFLYKILKSMTNKLLL